MFRKLLTTDNDRTTILLRLTLAVVLFPHGAQKVLGWFGGSGFSGTMDFFTSNMGIPAVLAFLAILAEFLGPLGLVSGLLTRVAAFGIGVTMTVAAFFHKGHGFFMNWFGNQQGEGFEYHLLAIGLALALVIKGGGAWSLDRKIAKG